MEKKMEQSKCGQYLMGIRCGSGALNKCWGVNMIMGSSVSLDLSCPFSCLSYEISN